MSSGVEMERHLIKKQEEEIICEIIELLKNKKFRTDIYTDNSSELSIWRAISILESTIGRLNGRAKSQKINDLF